jgi:acetoin utilization deacetylase AcuC-like enzyme
MADGVEDDTYLSAIGDTIPELLDQVQPDLVLYNAGVDPHRNDRLGRLNLSSLGLLHRDRLVLDACLRRNVAVATVIGGGYDALTPLVKRHSLVFRAACEQARNHGL